MRANSIIMLVLAVVFGTIAVFLTQSWLQSQASLASKAPRKATSDRVSLRLPTGIA